jgi:hypothetical protein
LNCFPNGQQGAAGIKMTFGGCFVISYGVSIAVADLLIRENLQIAFTTLQRD